MQIAVTGSSGLIGTALIAALRRDGTRRFRCATREQRGGEPPLGSGRRHDRRRGLRRARRGRAPRRGRDRRPALDPGAEAAHRREPDRDRPRCSPRRWPVSIGRPACSCRDRRSGGTATAARRSSPRRARRRAGRTSSRTSAGSGRQRPRRPRPRASAPCTCAPASSLPPRQRGAADVDAVPVRARRADRVGAAVHELDRDRRRGRRSSTPSPIPDVAGRSTRRADTGDRTPSSRRRSATC